MRAVQSVVAMAPGVSADRGRPVASAAVENFIRDRRLRQHKGHVQEARTKINNGWSNREEDKLCSSRQNAKKTQLEGERVAAIKHENMRLLQRMQQIDEKPAAVDSLPRSRSVPTIAKRGSNVGGRMVELRRIDSENQKMLKRLHAARPSMSMAKLDVEHNEQRKVMLMRCGLAYVLAPPPAQARSLQRRPSSAGRYGAGAYETDVNSTDHTPAETPSNSRPMTAREAADAEALAEELEQQATEGSAGGIEEASTPKYVGELEMFGQLGLVMPNASKQRLAKLLEDDAADRRLAAVAEAAKEAAAEAFRNATAVGSYGDGGRGNDSMNYDSLVQRYSEVEARRAPGLGTRLAVMAAA